MSTTISVYNESASLARPTNRREPTDPVTPPSPAPLVAPPSPSGFARWWRTALPIGLVTIAVALLVGVFDSSARPAWIFVVGAAVALVGVVSLVLFLVAKSRRGIAVLEAEIEDRFGGDEKR